MPLSAESIVQVNTGAVNSGTAMTMTMPVAPASQRFVMFVGAMHDDAGFISLFSATDPPTMVRNSATFGVAAPLSYMWRDYGNGAKTSWVFDTLDTVQKRMVWMCVEMSDINYDTSPTSTISLANGYDRRTDLTGSTTTMTTGTDVTSTSDEEGVIFAVFCARVSSGTPPTVTGFANLGADEPGTWSRVGSTVATTNGTGVNIRLDVAYKIVTAFPYDYGCQATYSSAPTSMSAFQDGWLPEFKVPMGEWVAPRSATR